MNNNITFSEQDLGEKEIETHNIDISKIIREKHRERRHALRMFEQQQQQQQIQTQSTQRVQTIPQDGVTLNTDIYDTNQKMITFRKDDKIEYPLSDTILPIQNQYHNGGTMKSCGNVCRICYDPDITDNPIIRVCQCIRTRKYVHEDCLKAQILDEYNYRIRDAKCSTCQMNFKMNIVGQRLYMPKLGWEQSQDKLPLIILILFVLTLIVVMIILAFRIVEIDQNPIKDQSQNFMNSKLFILLFIIFCGLISIILIWFIIMIIKGILFVERISEWNILQYIPEKKPIIHHHNIEISKDGVLKLQKLVHLHTKDDFLKSEHLEMKHSKYFASQAKLRQSVAF